MNKVTYVPSSSFSLMYIFRIWKSTFQCSMNKTFIKHITLYLQMLHWRKHFNRKLLQARKIPRCFQMSFFIISHNINSLYARSSARANFHLIAKNPLIAPATIFINKTFNDYALRNHFNEFRLFNIHVIIASQTRVCTQ